MNQTVLKPPGLPVITDIGTSGSLTGVVLNPEQDDSNKALPKVSK